MRKPRHHCSSQRAFWALCEFHDRQRDKRQRSRSQPVGFGPTLYGKPLGGHSNPGQEG